MPISRGGKEARLKGHSRTLAQATPPANWLTIDSIAIPGRAVIVFELGLRIEWAFKENWGLLGTGPLSLTEQDEIDDGVEVDLYSGEHRAWCGAVVLDLRT